VSALAHELTEAFTYYQQLLSENMRDELAHE
jgi:hypothetical protein